MPRRILLCVVPAKSCDRAQDFALEWLRPGDTLDLVYVYKPMKAPSRQNFTVDEGEAEKLHEERKEILREIASAIYAPGGPSGSPAACHALALWGRGPTRPLGTVALCSCLSRSCLYIPLSLRMLNVHNLQGIILNQHAVAGDPKEAIPRLSVELKVGLSSAVETGGPFICPMGIGAHILPLDAVAMSLLSSFLTVLGGFPLGRYGCGGNTGAWQGQACFAGLCESAPCCDLPETDMYCAE